LKEAFFQQQIGKKKLIKGRFTRGSGVNDKKLNFNPTNIGYRLVWIK